MIKIDEQSFCESCFEKTDSYPCPRCGFAGNDEKRNAVALAKGTILQGRYIIGKMLGKGGFGITYLAYDYKNKCRVAIKEYFPNGIIYRQPGQTRAEAYDDKTEILEDGAEKFYQEAKTVSKFHKNENIITVYEFFKENNTSYFVMEYLDGVDLKTYVEKRGVLSEGEMKAVLYAAVNVLGEIHGEGVLHRDLSPDNIFVCNDGRIMFLDFGAARQLIAEKSQSMSIILKQGFAPFEQYQRKSNQGPWSDIYAMGATAYFAMFGAVPDDAISRISSPELQIPDKYSVSIPMRAILNKMLAVFPESRYQSAAELKADLDGNDIVPVSLIPNGTIPDAPRDDGDDEDKKEKSSKKGLLIGIISALVLALVIVIVLFCLKTCSSDSSGGSGGSGGSGSGSGTNGDVTTTQSGKDTADDDGADSAGPSSDEQTEGETQPTETYPQMNELLSSMFSVNNDDYGYVISDKEQFTEGETITVTAVAKKGYEFKQWNDGDTNAQKTVITNFERDYIATFEAKTMTVTLKSDTTQTMTVRYGEIYGTLPTLSKEGFVFAGWYDSQTGGNKILPESVVSADSDHTLYARFETASLVSLMITSTGHKIGYISGEKLDISGLSVVGVYSDGSEKPITGFTVSPAANSTLTTSTNVTISYEGKTVEYYVSVTAEQISSISITSSPSKTSYFEGDTLNTSGLSIKVTYNNGRTETVSSNIATTPANGTVLSADNKNLVVNYGGKTASVALTVKPVAPESIEVYSMPNKASYYEGDRFNIAGLKIRVNNNNGSSSVISSGFTTNPANGAVLSTSTKKITVTYEGKTTSFNITVSPVAVSSISIASTPKTEYFKGDKLDISGLSINVIYNNGKTELLQTGFTTTPANGATLNMQSKTLTVSYGGKTTSISLNIKDVVVTYIEIETFPTKTSYTVGDAFSSSGLSIRVHYNNGTSKKTTSGFTVSVSDGTVLTAGTKTVTVTYQGKTDSFKITTVQPDKCSINVEAQPSEGGTVTGGGEYVKGSSITIKATPKAGYVFDGWYNGNTRVSTSKNYTFTLNSDYPNMVARFSIKPYTYTDNTSHVIDSSAFWGMGPNYMDELDMSEYKQFMTSEYKFTFQIEMKYKEIDDGIQEIYLYNSDETTESLEMDYNVAVEMGMLSFVNTIGSTGNIIDEILGNANGVMDEGTYTVTWTVTGDKMEELMYIRYDCHGTDENDWYRQGIKVNVTVEENA